MKSFLFIMALVLCSQAQAQDTWSLQRCISYAREHNIQLKIAALGLDMADENIKANRLSRYPTLNGQLGLGEYFGRNVDPTTYQFTNQAINTGQLGLNTNLNLYSGNRIKHTEEQLLLDKHATEYDIQKSENDLALMISSYYLQILLSREQLNSARNFEVLTQKQYDKVKESYRYGAVPESNLAEIEAQLVSAQSTVSLAENAITASTSNLKMLLELPLEQSFEIEQPRDLLLLSEVNSMSSAMIYEDALDFQPQLKSRDLRLQSAMKSIDIAKTYQKPSVSLYGSMNSNYSSAAQRIKGITYSNEILGYVLDTIPISYTNARAVYEKNPVGSQLDQNFNQSLGMSVNIPIFNGGQVRSNIAKAKLSLRQQELLLESDKTQLRKDVQAAVIDRDAAKLKYENALKKEEALRKSFSYIETKYKAGLLTSFEFFSSQNNVLAAEIETLQAKYEYIFKMKILDFYAGKEIKI